MVCNDSYFFDCITIKKVGDISSGTILGLSFYKRIGDVESVAFLGFSLYRRVGGISWLLGVSYSHG